MLILLLLSFAGGYFVGYKYGDKLNSYAVQQYSKLKAKLKG